MRAEMRSIKNWQIEIPHLAEARFGMTRHNGGDRVISGALPRQSATDNPLDQESNCHSE
jgi:hypothetical protein